ncbi:MXAN_6640 family putative metalloprotease [Nocardioides daeguensis]|uniref:Uncharacterized protein n=1 Tax=Nocardioides daeguensis TaxID=908359 RepID=A0ABP6VAJ5_9ACTN|nr:MXAN_6640 family putative metalloprotease [Nocardioides daeguensis]MBV6726030.1 hypothetical protein [Nocardioides daeguensis]MCR1771873.1 hypothetical protein [Nocardioides daeguensis]
MPRRSHFPLLGLPFSLLVSALLAALLAVPFLGTAAQADTPVPIDVDDVVARAAAEQALETVQDIVDPTAGTTGPAVADAISDAELTVALRDLAVTRDDLPTSLQDDAARLLARPRRDDPVNGIECTPGSPLPCYADGTTETATCGDGICVHYVTSSADAPREPGYPGTVLDVMKNVRNRYVDAGYRLPQGDGLNGTKTAVPNNGVNVFDVYLANLGERGLYGYCTTDTRVSGHITAPAYCVLDNDYAEYGPVPGPLGNLQVTAAHEYFHAVQFAYDVNEEGWLLEATATWAEDEVYDDINDNRQYLKGGPLRKPAQSMDHRRGIAPYGAWIFFKYLSERFPALNGPAGMPVIVRDIWETAAGAPDARQAIGAALSARGTDLRTQFAWFSAANRRPAANYSEGAAYPRARLWRGVKLSGSRRSFSASTDLDNLASQTVRFRSKVAGRAHLRVHVDGPSRKRGGYVLVTIRRKGHPPVTQRVKINGKGDKTKRFAFGKKIKWVEITFANSGKRDGTATVSASVVR